MNATVSYADNDTPDATEPINALSNNALLDFYLEHCSAGFTDQYIQRIPNSGTFLVISKGLSVARIIIT